jgi:hypothetical protein
MFDENGDVANFASDVVVLTGIYEFALKFGKVVYVEEPLVVYNSNTGFNDGHIHANEQTKTAQGVQNSPYSILNLV